MGKTETLEYTQNRELSWLRFNQRVLEEAQDESVPLMERMKFVAIFTSNLDEFFMIRVGSLYDMAVADSKKQDIRSGMTPKQQLEEIYKAVAPLYKERDKTYAKINPSFIGIFVLKIHSGVILNRSQKYFSISFPSGAAVSSLTTAILRLL